MDLLDISPLTRRIRVVNYSFKVALEPLPPVLQQPHARHEGVDLTLKLLVIWMAPIKVVLAEVNLLTDSVNVLVNKFELLVSIINLLLTVPHPIALETMLEVVQVLDELVNIFRHVPRSLLLEPFEALVLVDNLELRPDELSDVTRQ